MNFVFCDSTQNYPKQFSPANTKLDLVTDYMISEGHSVSIINSCFGYERFIDEELVYKNKRCYFYRRKKSLFIKNYFNVLKKILILRKVATKNILFVTWNHFLLYVIEVIWARILGYKVIVIFHEKNSSLIVNHSSFYRRCDSKLFDSIFGYFSNGIFPISNYLKRMSQKFNKPQFLFPIIADFSVDRIQNRGNGYFLYCGNVCYFRIIYHILKAYHMYRKNKGLYSLHLILNGDETFMNNILENIMKHEYKNEILILSGLSQTKLFEEYSNANALLIPLDENNEQDRARFSQKIAEYLSSKRPIITNFVGDIPIYFKHKINAYICKNLDASILATILTHIEYDNEEADMVGLNGFRTGQKFFDYKKVTQRMISFLKQI